MYSFRPLHIFYCIVTNNTLLSTTAGASVDSEDNGIAVAAVVNNINQNELENSSGVFFISIL